MYENNQQPLQPPVRTPLRTPLRTAIWPARLVPERQTWPVAVARKCVRKGVLSYVCKGVRRDVRTKL